MRSGPGHDHTLVFATTTGSGWVRLLAVAGVLVLVASALLRPFVPASGRAARLAVTVIAGGVALLMLVVSDGLDMPQRGAALAVLSMGVPVAVARHRTEADPSAVTGTARRAAPWVVLGATAYAASELYRAGHGGPDVRQYVDTGVLVGVVGLAWLVACGPASPGARAAVHVVAWVLGNVTLAGITFLCVAGNPT